MKTIEVIESVRLGHLLIQDLEKINYCQLSILFEHCSKELKKRDMSIGQSTGNCRSGNYKGELK
jgi:hypothetical protein